MNLLSRSLELIIPVLAMVCYLTYHIHIMHLLGYYDLPWTSYLFVPVWLVQSSPFSDYCEEELQFSVTLSSKLLSMQFKVYDMMCSWVFFVNYSGK